MVKYIQLPRNVPLKNWLVVILHPLRLQKNDTYKITNSIQNYVIKYSKQSSFIRNHQTASAVIPNCFHKADLNQPSLINIQMYTLSITSAPWEILSFLCTLHRYIYKHHKIYVTPKCQKLRNQGFNIDLQCRNHFPRCKTDKERSSCFILV